MLWGSQGQQPDVATVQDQWAAALADEPDARRRLERLSRVLGDRRMTLALVAVQLGVPAASPSSLQTDSLAARRLASTVRMAVRLWRL